MTEILIVAVLLFILVREYVYQKSVNSLVDKLMSRNYHEYKSAQVIYDKKADNQVDLKLDDSEDVSDLITKMGIN